MYLNSILFESPEKDALLIVNRARFSPNVTFFASFRAAANAGKRARGDRGPGFVSVGDAYMRPVANGGAMKTGQPRDGSAFVGAVREPPVVEWRRAGTHYRRPMNAPRRGEISRRRKTRAVHEPPLRDLTPSGGWFPNCGMPLRNPSRRRASRVDNHRGLSLRKKDAPRRRQP